MFSKIFISTTAIALMSGAALAGSSTVNGAVGGAATGAIVGGPAGAAVGGAAGAVVGTLLDPPPKVVTYVREAPPPADTVVIKEKVVVGQPLPEAVAITPVPDDPKYAYTVVNDQRVIVEPSSRKVIQIVN
ncbi:hypothetical protein AM571_PC00543 (plasmid) [Rhizobium etli 8C-3]|uniref:DUF1236 domain-containing protein n=1 Tax=Rhizobium etli 8C-3 TaxID=538025 RepID=A0A1L5PDK3_RHIET|nr:DUF1236 domain-containing protein [Rhizobium etli]APO78281.1 hypothetical protein AM571_PC00543 [Rhizobium etli 8C-3]